jgi:hypothetical protein
MSTLALAHQRDRSFTPSAMTGLVARMALHARAVHKWGFLLAPGVFL